MREKGFCSVWTWSLKGGNIKIQKYDFLFNVSPGIACQGSLEASREVLWTGYLSLIPPDLSRM